MTTGPEDGSVAVIARTNFTLFEEVMHFCDKNRNSKIAFVGGIESYEYDTILDMYRLKDGLSIDNVDSQISSVSSWDVLEKQVNDNLEFSLKWKIKVFSSS